MSMSVTENSIGSRLMSFFVNRKFPFSITALVPLALYLTPLWGDLLEYCYDEQIGVMYRDSGEVGYAIVEMDDVSARELEGASRNCAWDTRLHLDLVAKLLEYEPRLIVFDIVFANCESTGGDAAFSEFLKQLSGSEKVLFGATTYSVCQSTLSEVFVDLPRFPDLDKNAENRTTAGIVGLDSFSDDNAVRILPRAFGLEGHHLGFQKLAWLAVEESVDNAVAPGGDGHWLRYSLIGKELDDVTLAYRDVINESNGVNLEILRDKVVFVGGAQSIGYSGATKDSYNLPFGVGESDRISGVALQANLYECYRRGDWLRSVPFYFEIPIILFLSFVICALLNSPILTVRRIALCAFVGIPLSYFAFPYLANYLGLVFNWMIAPAVILPVAALSEISRKSIRDWKDHALKERERERASDRQLSLLCQYFPRHIAEKVHTSDNLEPKLCNATVLYTDMADFSSKMFDADPNDALLALKKYYNLIVDTIVDNEGIVVGFKGDAVIAAWGIGPETLYKDELDPRALIAARNIVDLTGATKVFLDTLNTRVGVTFGKVSAGNIGSESRFDFAVTGSCVNMASRLEGMCKLLKVKVLAGVELLPDEFSADSRFVGRFRPQGALRPMSVYQIFTEKEPMYSREKLNQFEAAVRSLEYGDFKKSKALFATYSNESSTSDPVADFYIAELNGTHKNIEDTGVVVTGK